MQRVSNHILDEVVPPSSELLLCQFIFANRLTPLGCIYVRMEEQDRPRNQVTFFVAIDTGLAEGGELIFDALYGTFEHMLNLEDLSRTSPPEEQDGILTTSFTLTFGAVLKEHKITQFLLNLREFVVGANAIAIAARLLKPE
jgi:hypothetical protein